MASDFNPQPATVFATVEEAVAEIRAGRMVVVVDDEDRENEGDLTLAAEFVTPENINFMARFGRGLICLTLTEERADYLRLAPMTQENTSRFGTAFTETIEAREGVTTGISAADRAHTIRVAVDSRSTANDLARPGHVFPLRARRGGVLVRAGQTEASVDLARLAGVVPAGVICEVMNEDGTMARVPDLTRFCAEHNLKMLTVASLIRYRLQNERYIHRVAEAVLPTSYGDFRMIAYESEVDGAESHVALVYGDEVRDGEASPSAADEPMLVRVHTHCLAGDVFGTTLCDCHALMDNSLRMIADAGRGALIYLHNGSRGFGIDRSGRTERADRPVSLAAFASMPNAAAPYRLILHRDASREPRATEACDDRGHRTQRTLRQVGLGGQILSDLGIRRIRLLTNTPTHVPALQGFGIEIVEQVAIPLSRHESTPTAR
jgi:3,4-dihydroxy 2-butanone 4-phosphate synthase / GTP cyclohydrolase II